jgi:hypothetical protein
MKKNRGHLKKEAFNAIAHLIDEICKVEGTIQALLDVALNLQDQLSNLIVSQVEFTLPIGEEKLEAIATNESVRSHEIADYIIKIGPVNIYTMAGALKETFTKFETLKELETVRSSITNIFREFPINILPQDMPYGTSNASIERFLCWEVVGKVLVVSSLIESLQSAKSAEVRVPVTPLLSEHVEKKEVKASSSILEQMKEFAHHVKEFSITVEGISTELYTKIMKAGKVIDSSALYSLSTYAPASFELTHMEQNPTIYSIERLDYIKNFSEVSETISSALHTRILDAHTIADVSAFDKLSSRPLSVVLSKGEQRPVVYQGQTMVEIPVFKPRGKVLVPSEEASINAARLLDAIAINHNNKKDASVLKDSPSASMMPYVLSKYVSNAFETISDYVTMAYEINNQINEMTGQNENTISKIAEPFNLLLAGNEASPGFTLERIAIGRNGGMAAEGQMVNIAQSIAAAEGLQRAGASAIKDVTLAVPPSGGGYSWLPSTMVSRTIENTLQILSVSPGENAVAPTGSSTIYFHNTFNIAVNVKGGGEENELRELGRKIGVIFSEEIKRYGGTR